MFGIAGPYTPLEIVVDLFLTIPVFAAHPEQNPEKCDRNFKVSIDFDKNLNFLYMNHSENISRLLVVQKWFTVVELICGAKLVYLLLQEY